MSRRPDEKPMLGIVPNHMALMVEHPCEWPLHRIRAWTVWWTFIESREAMALAVRTARDLARDGQ